MKKCFLTIKWIFFYNLLLLWNQKRKKVHFSIWGWCMCISKHQSFHHFVSGSWKWDYLMFNLTKPKVNLTTQDLITKNLWIHKKEHQSSHLYLSHSCPSKAWNIFNNQFNLWLFEWLEVKSPKWSPTTQLSNKEVK